MTLYRLLPVPALVLLSLVYLLPLAQVLVLSVTDPVPGLGNYALLFTSAGIARMLGNTAAICAIATTLALVLAYPVSYLLTQSRPTARRLILACVLLPLWVSVLARAFAWVALLRREGLVNAVLQAAGLTTEPLALMWNGFGVAVGMVHYLVPFAILAMAAHMDTIDRTLLAAARGLGASPLQAFVRVFLPQSMPGVAGAAVLTTIFSAGFYVTPKLLGGGRVLMIAEYITLQIQELLRWGVGAMLAATLLLGIAAVLAAARVIGLRTPGLAR